MIDRARRRELRARALQTPPRAGVYLLRNTVTGWVLLDSSVNLGGVVNKLDFGKSTGTVSVLDHRLRRDAEEVGIDAFALEVVETLAVTPTMTRDELRTDLAALLALCEENLGAAPRY